MFTKPLGTLAVLRTLLTWLGLAALFAAAGWLWFSFSPPEVQPPADQPYVYGYCPRCGLEMTLPLGARVEPPPCFRCDRKDAPLFVISDRPHDAFSVQKVLPDRRLLAVAVAVPTLLAAALLLARRPKKSEGQNAVLIYRCPDCSHPLRYRASQAGQHGLCPSCKKRITYPPPPEKADVTAWVKGLARWSMQIRQKKERDRNRQ
jgi:hypothetical protein